MNSIKDKIQAYLKGNNNKIDSIIIMRLYEYYCKNIDVCSNKKENLTHQTIVKIFLAYKKIITMYKTNINFKFQDEKSKYLNVRIILLENYMNSLDLRELKNRKKVIDVITTLEVLLDMEVSFPQYVLEFLEEKVNIITEKKIK